MQHLMGCLVIKSPGCALIEMASTHGTGEGKSLSRFRADKQRARGYRPVLVDERLGKAPSE